VAYCFIRATSSPKQGKKHTSQQMKFPF